jgi:hypothetical protein
MGLQFDVCLFTNNILVLFYIHFAVFWVPDSSVSEVS